MPVWTCYIAEYLAFISGNQSVMALACHYEFRFFSLQGGNALPPCPCLWAPMTKSSRRHRHDCNILHNWHTTIIIIIIIFIFREQHNTIIIIKWTHTQGCQRSTRLTDWPPLQLMNAWKNNMQFSQIVSITLVIYTIWFSSDSIRWMAAITERIY